MTASKDNTVKKLDTPKCCLAAVQKNGLVLEYVTKALKTSERCLIAVKECGLSLYSVPKKS